MSEEFIPGAINEGDLFDEENPSPQIEELKAQLRERDREVRSLERIIAREDRLINSLRDCAKALPAPRKPKAIPSSSKNKPPMHPVICIADPHGEEFVDPKETEGLLHYDWNVFRDRLYTTALKTIRIVENQRYEHTISGINVFLLGDMLTGELHKDAVLTNMFSPPMAAVQIGWVLAQTTNILSGYFDKVTCTGVVGNHGRLDEKPLTKKAAERSFDTAIYQIAALLNERNPRITWGIPKGISTIANVGGHRCLLKHGDDVKGGIHPFYPLVRDTAREADRRRGTNADFDWIFQGHLHHWTILEERRYLCPSLKGGDQYTSRLTGKTTPAQLLALFGDGEKKRAPVAWPIDLREPAKHQFQEMPNWE